ncbi:plakophilin-3-like [Scleropages formosus]|uniref:Plakophilin 3 n=1 Tax=Scleropages formosus TaxID=113540 RepID=A0A8C9RM85_SCLFO|nr:plakophilin-3-like [Scleropages formosus]
MSASVAPDAVFLSALPPSGSSMSTYAVPTDAQLEHGNAPLDEAARARRVQQQVQMRLAEKSSAPLSSVARANGSVSNYASSEYGGSVKYATYSNSASAGFSSRSHMYNMGRTLPNPRISQYSGGFSSRSAVDFAPRPRSGMMGTAGGGMYLDELPAAAYQTSSHQQMMSRSVSRPDPDTLSVHSMRLYNLPQQAAHVSSYATHDGSEGSLSDHDAPPYQQSVFTASNGFAAHSRQMSGSASAPATMRRSLSGTLSRGAVAGGGGVMEVVQQHSFKGPAYRTISRINNRNNRMSVGSMSGTGTLQHQASTGSGSRVAVGQMMVGSQGSIVIPSQRQGTLSRAMSVKSVQSVGRGADVIDSWKEMTESMGNLDGFSNLDMITAVNYLSTSEADLQVLGAAYIQHECYHNNEAKSQVRQMKGIPALVHLFNSESQEVQRYATGAMRNIIYENMENKTALIDAGGIPQLVSALKEPDDELRKNITGILWNLSSKDSLKEKLAKDTLGELTEKILVPLSQSKDSERIQQSPSEVDIFYNTTGCLRNLSSVNEKTRTQMRETRGLVDSLVSYIRNCIENGSAEDKGVENSMCVLRNLSYQLYNEMPPSVIMRLEGPSRGQDSSRGDAIGCFTPQSKKAKDRQNQDLSLFAAVAKDPKGQEWLWHPQVVGLYNRVLQRCEMNTVTREAAAGALQNITAGEKRWASVLSRTALEQERMLPLLLDQLRTHSDQELRSLTGFLRNLSRHTKDKGDMATKVVNILVSKLPSDGYQKEPSSDVVVNICGVLNNLVTGSSLAARDITYFDGLGKLVGIKNSHDNSPGKLKAAKAAATVLCNMFQYKKLHKDYKQKGFTRMDFADMTI